MFGHSDQDYFDALWKRKIEDNSIPNEYVPGLNLRVDEALRTITTGTRLLDIGCGNGILLSMVMDRFEEVVGIDISETAIALAREKGYRADLVNLNIELLPYSEGFFDTITILSAIQYFYDVDSVLKECWRVLAPSGVLILSVPNIRAIWRIWKLLVGGTFSGVSCDGGSYDGGTLHYFATSNIVDVLTRNEFDTVLAKGIFCKPAIMSHLSDQSIAGALKREFFSAEIFIKARKGRKGSSRT